MMDVKMKEMVMKRCKESKGVTFTTPPGLVSFPHLLEPHAIEGGNYQSEPKYSVDLLYSKDQKEKLGLIMGKAREAVKEISGEQGLQRLWPQVKKAIKDGDITKDLEKYPNYKGHYSLTARNKSRVAVVDNFGDTIKDEALVYPGCVGRANVTFKVWLVDTTFYLSCYLNGFQKLADGEPFGTFGGAPSKVDFGEVPQEYKQSGDDIFSNADTALYPGSGVDPNQTGPTYGPSYNPRVTNTDPDYVPQSNPPARDIIDDIKAYNMSRAKTQETGAEYRPPIDELPF